MALEFSQDIINQVWEKGQHVPNYDPNQYRKDVCGAWIIREMYGNQTSAFGWVVDFIKPLSKGGTNDIENLHPLQWQNNVNKGDNFPEWQCVVTAVESKNELIIPTIK